MRYYLDTNILVFMVFSGDGLSSDVGAILSDPGNLLYTSTVCAMELVHLAQTGRIKTGRKRSPSAETVLAALDGVGIGIVEVTRKHLDTFSALPIVRDHNDPNDRMIIAQAISDRIPLISSDGKFDRYIPQGLEFVYNER